MTSLGRVGRILAGTIDVSSTNNEKDGQSSNNVKTRSSIHNAQPGISESVDLKELDKQTNISVASTLMQGIVKWD